jgi:hypothetical protein
MFYGSLYPIKMLSSFKSLWTYPSSWRIYIFFIWIKFILKLDIITYQLNNYHVNSLFTKTFTRTLLQKLSQISSQSFHKNLSLIWIFNIWNYFRKSNQFKVITRRSIITFFRSKSNIFIMGIIWWRLDFI